ncbi:MAG: hypothetical protein WBL63_20515 [Candidatus Acidiferrum sp.]
MTRKTKKGLSRTFRYPSDHLRDKVRAAVKGRGFRSEQAFLIAACQNELERGDSGEAMDDLEARIVAPLLNMGREVQSLFTLVHTQVALTNCLLQYVLTCVAEPPEDVLPAARARARLRYAKILRLAGQEVATRNKATLEQILESGKQS